MTLAITVEQEQLVDAVNRFAARHAPIDKTRAEFGRIASGENVLEPGEANVQHVHSISEDTIFILKGEGTVHDYTNDVRLPFHAGCAVHVPVGIKHAIAADRGVEIVSVGGPAPADVPLLKKVGALPSDAEPPAR